ncbi:MAG: methyltransferase domain-containing protein, partial [Magnetococcales bacterium]|nr:methyltransferase domain-containing protein [Magnetococcales bacterium]
MGNGEAASGSGAAAVTVHPAVARLAWRRAWRRADPFLRQGQSFPARVGEVLFSRLEEIRLTPRRVLDYGCRGGSISPLMAQRWPEAERIVAGPVREMLTGQPGWGVEADPLRLPFASGSFDLVMASLSLHWSGDLPRALSEARRVLAPGGLFLGAIPGEGTLGELQSALAAEASSSGGL